jgi:hypothetical protein
MKQQTERKHEHIQKFENLEEGDRVLFNGRKEPLTVETIYTNEPRKPEHTESRTVYVRSSRDTLYSLVQSMVNNNYIGIVSHGNTHDSDKGQIRELEVVG